MKELDEILDNLVGISKSVYTVNNPNPLPENWRMCLSLSNQGWVINRYEPVPNNPEHMIFVFEKDGKEKEVYMGFADQQKWLRIVMGNESDV